MSQSYLPFYAGEDPNGIAYSGSIEQLLGAKFITVDNYMSVYMVVGDVQIPPCWRRTVTTDGVTPAIGWKITHPSSFVIQRKLNLATISPSEPAIQSEPLFPATAPYGIVAQSGDGLGIWPSSSLVQSILIGDGNWFNPSIMGITIAWKNMVVTGGYVSYRHKHDFAASVPIFRPPAGEGQINYIPLPGVAALVMPAMTAQPAGAELMVTAHLGWLTV